MPRMDHDEARRRFTSARVARLATVDTAGRPHLVPVVFAVRDETGAAQIVTAVDRKPKSTTRLARLRNIGASPSVCLLADAYDEEWGRLWWARADGRARILSPHSPDAAARREYETVLADLRVKYPQYRDAPPHGPAITIDVRRWTGWRADAAPDG
ncbi:TIGR03668 family PPOX class F420-dependent oxidoreductase [Streptomyces sp. NPDC046985]|uniref:TIGR03668 family PPOX class F420-dependent oxidoreductase n=1 Tax=Streptomyces sp. NPDC046985 TaxID=3155377 RepID=UPI003402376E